jgi:hypothetical protein
MAKIQVHHKDQIRACTFTSEDILTVASEEGVTLVADSKDAVLTLRLTLDEYRTISLKVHQYISTKRAEGA